MDREAGSYIEKDGELVPNPDDEAMAERHNLKKKKAKEVKDNAGHGKAGE